MKLCIFGSRELSPAMVDIDEAVERLFSVHRLRLEARPITQVISGCSRGVDEAGEAWARRGKLQLVLYPADWRKHGPKAGPLRNAEMAEACDAAVGFWDGESRGTGDMIAKLRTRGRPYVVVPMGVRR